MKERVLVIGGAGFLGTVLTGRLLKKGYPVRILDSFIYGKNSVKKFTVDENVEIIEGDIRNIETVNKTMDGIGAVIHLAAVVGDPAGAKRPEQTIETNYLASQVIASACKMKGINRFIYASTCSVYGISKSANGELDENAELNPVSLYAKTKISSEESIMQLVDEKFAPTIMRMSTLYGNSPRMRFDLVVNTMTMTAYTDKHIKVFGGKQWRPLLHVDDAADSYIKVLEADVKIIRGKIYNVGSEVQNYRIQQVADMTVEAINELTGTEIPLKTETADVDARDYRVSFKKIQNELGFEVKRSISEAVKDIYSNLESGVIKDPKQKVYYNHYFDSSEELIG
jgi:nucleoside-diphosphate-sugar epimerase